MKFLEKSLEDILHKQLDYCCERGFNLHCIGTLQLRQLNLAPFGIADLVHFGVEPASGSLLIRVIECKREKLDVATYTQAARYQAAIMKVLGSFADSGPIAYEKVLIGQRVDAKGDFWHLIHLDQQCSVFTYSYEADGIRFKRLIPAVELGPRFINVGSEQSRHTLMDCAYMVDAMAVDYLSKIQY